MNKINERKREFISVTNKELKHFKGRELTKICVRESNLQTGRVTSGVATVVFLAAAAKEVKDWRREKLNNILKF